MPDFSPDPAVKERAGSRIDYPSLVWWQIRKINDNFTVENVQNLEVLLEPYKDRIYQKKIDFVRADIEKSLSKIRKKYKNVLKQEKIKLFLKNCEINAKYHLSRNKYIALVDLAGRIGLIPENEIIDFDYPPS